MTCEPLVEGWPAAVQYCPVCGSADRGFLYDGLASMVFGAGSLSNLLAKAGFRSIRRRWRGMSVFDVYTSSQAIAQRVTGAVASHQGTPPRRVIRAELCEMLQTSRREFLTLMAWK
jgi:hypothetical protein